MNSRDAILHRIRSSVAQDKPLARPPVPEVWPRQNPPVEQMVQRFTAELQAVSGEVVRAATVADAQAALAGLFVKNQWSRLGTVDAPLCKELTANLPGIHVVQAQSDWTPRGMSDLPVGLVEADYLLADTGSAMVACGKPEERLMCYLPPVCIIAATADRLREHMPAVWGEVATRCADPELRGEFVFITGPSRTADIEKILILGVHGPQRLIVLLIG